MAEEEEEEEGEEEEAAVGRVHAARWRHQKVEDDE
jgi:hypothetical protein